MDRAIQEESALHFARVIFVLGHFVAKHDLSLKQYNTSQISFETGHYLLSYIRLRSASDSFPFNSSNLFFTSVFSAGLAYCSFTIPRLPLLP